MTLTTINSLVDTRTINEMKDRKEKKSQHLHCKKKEKKGQ